jgi:hypothetical protein
MTAKFHYSVRLEVLSVEAVKNPSFWDVMPCSLVIEELTASIFSSPGFLFDPKDLRQYVTPKRQ